MRTFGMFFAFLTSVTLVAVSGCGGAGGEQIAVVPFSGKVTMDGAPLPKAVVSFLPATGTEGSGGSAFTDENGQYQATSAGGEPGLPAGNYRVVISKMTMADGSDVPPDADDAMLMGSGAKQVVPPQYSSMERPTLEATVPPDGGTRDFDLKSRG